MATTAACLASHMKPPNVILIDAIKATGNLEKLHLSLNTCLDPDQYTIHQLSIEDIFTKPWKTNAIGVLLTNSESLNRNHWQEMYKFYRDGGIVVFFYSGLLQSLGSLDACVFFPEDSEARRMLFTSMDLASEQEYFKGLNQNGEMFTLSWDAATPSPTTVFYAAVKHCGGIVAFSNFYECTSGEGSAQYLRSLLSKVGFSVRSATYQPPAYTPGRLFIEQELANDLEKRFIDIGTIRGNKMTIQFVRNLGNGAKPTSGSYLPVLVGGSKESTKELNDHLKSIELQKTHHTKDAFDSDLYFRYLKTSTMGKVVLYVPVMNSTMDVFDGLRLSILLLTGNLYASINGIAYLFFSLLGASKGFSSSLFQKITALMVIFCFKGTPLRLKWPNDVYTSDKVKIGGVLVQSTVSSISCNFVVGCGLNLANEKPTISLNSIIPKGAPPLQAAQVIALALSSMEKFVRMVEKNSTDELRALYRKYWLHSGQRVKMADTGESVEVIDLDKHGYLLVRSEETGKMFSLQPDGNSFDMMHNMIRSKT
ncbi:hlcs protein [Trichuris trichiura]|uniref:Hlcs protein n=1 Tax=Trichuris trichiura TaxID=36087 RepID=A0A077ZI08_TRITR|nr:hlcs protein [Trichuris trichiura]